VLDSVLFRAHPALRSCVVASGASFTSGDPFDDPGGHGTGCTGLLVARDGHGGPAGMVPEVALHIGQVVGPSGEGSVETLCAGLRWTAQLGVDVVAIPSGLLYPYPDLERALADVLDTGALVLAAAGNPFLGQAGPLFPAAYPEVIAVGCLAYRESYLSWSRPPDVVVAAHDLPVCTPDGRWRPIGGTSQATMLVTAVACRIVSQRRSRSVLATRSLRAEFLDRLAASERRGPGQASGGRAMPGHLSRAAEPCRGTSPR
jgi:minor extracellular protease Epr